jgi:hypothetical protein
VSPARPACASSVASDDPEGRRVLRGERLDDVLNDSLVTELDQWTGTSGDRRSCSIM